ncbi:MAG: DUF4810 domain-containing protein [Bacteroidales bacterium]|nr:DUF4810 domain-containing protein [Bacteroidales bacterium]
MKRFLFLGVVAVMLSSCTASRMYYWGSNPSSDGGTTRYESLAYRLYDAQSPQSVCDLVCLYEDMVQHPGGTRGVVPPGICAEYGYLLLQASTAEAFEKYATNKQRRAFESSNYAQIFPEKGEQMLKKEIELYPESAKFIAPLLKRLTGK